MELKIEPILIILIGCILLAAILPTALNSLYDTNSDTFHFGTEGRVDGNGKAIAEDYNGTADSPTSSIWNLLPLFGVLAGLGVLAAVGMKEFRKE